MVTGAVLVNQGEFTGVLLTLIHPFETQFATATATASISSPTFTHLTFFSIVSIYPTNCYFVTFKSLKQRPPVRLWRLNHATFIQSKVNRLITESLLKQHKSLTLLQLTR